MVARERPAAAVGAMHAGRETYNQEARIRLAERRHRATMVVRVTFLNLIQERGKPRASPTLQIKNGFVQASVIRVIHMPDNGFSEAARPKQRGTGHQDLQFLLDVLLAVRPTCSLRLLNRRP